MSRVSAAARAYLADRLDAESMLGGTEAMVDAVQQGRGADARALADLVSADGRRRTQVAQGARAKLARRSLYHFFVQGWGALEPDTKLDLNWHHKLVCDVIQGILTDWMKKRSDKRFRQRARSAIFNLPPGTTKSRIISVFAPAWMWLHCPTWSVLCLSANPDVATRDAGYSRDLIESDWYRQTFGITWAIRSDIDAKGKFKNTMGGERTSRGLTSKIVGNRADAILIDDPNDMYDVFSEPSRREVNSKFDNAIFNRVNDQRSSVRILMQQRGHEDDLTGHWLRKDKNALHVNLPMEFDRARRFQSVFGVDPRNDNGQLLHEERFTPEFIADEKHRLGTFGFEAQYNQNPGSLDGEMFPRIWWRFFTIAGRPGEGFARPLGCATNENAPAVELANKVAAKSDAHWTKKLDLDELFVSVDATFGSVSDTASEVGLIAVGRKGAKLYVLEDRTEVMTFPTTKAAVRSIIADYPATRRTLIEKKANGQAVIDDLTNEIPGLVGIDPEGGKSARASVASARVEAHDVLLLEGARWLAKWVEQFGMFPHGKRNDRVDALSQLVVHLTGKGTAKSRWKALAS